MKYSDGRTAHIGDRVRLGNEEGVLVFSIDTDEFSDGFPKADWEYLVQGVMAEFPTLGLVHIPALDAELRFLGAGSA